MSQSSHHSLGGADTFHQAGDPRLPEASGSAADAGSAACDSLSDNVTFGAEGTATGLGIASEIEIVELAPRYRIERQLGRGGMGEVLLATDTRLGRKVAIKRILADMAGSGAALLRFLREAQAIASLNHVHIVQVYDSGRDREGPYLILEYVDGGSLQQRCDTGPIPLEETITIVSQVSLGLARAHTAGIVHRDIKPANILLTSEKIPKLTDFGLARQASETRHTITGAVMGTPDYMAPEQRRDATQADARSDLWSLAATTYQMVTGRRPNVIRLNDLPPPLRGILSRALEDDPAGRFQSVEEFREALLRSRRGGGTPVDAGSGSREIGECVVCEAVNEPARKFCRQCAGPLRSNCLGCQAEIPVWDDVCGECGGRQSQLLTRLSDEAARLCDEAEACEAAGESRTALDLLRRIPELSADSRLEPIRQRVADNMVRVETTVRAEEHRAAELFAEARAHAQAYDDPAAVRALEGIAERMRTEEMRNLLESSRARDEEARALLRQIKDRVRERQLSGLLPLVERARVLRPQRTDLARLQEQLSRRSEAAEHRAAKVVAEARSLLANQQYEEVLQTLAGLGGKMTDEAIHLERDAQARLDRTVSLRRRIESESPQRDRQARLAEIDEYLALRRADAGIQAIRARLLDELPSEMTPPNRLKTPTLSDLPDLPDEPETAASPRTRKRRDDLLPTRGSRGTAATRERERKSGMSRRTVLGLAALLLLLPWAYTRVTERLRAEPSPQGASAGDSGPPNEVAIAAETPAGTATENPATPPPPLKEGGVDLLALIDVGRDAVKGEWRREGAAIVSPSALDLSLIRIPYEAPDEYSLEIRARNETGDVLVVGLANRTCGFGAFLSSQTKSHVEELGLTIGARMAGYAREAFFARGRTSVVACDVRRDSLRVTENGVQKMQLQADMREWARRPHYLMPSGADPRSMFLVTSGRYVIDAIRLHPSEPGAKSAVRSEGSTSTAFVPLTEASTGLSNMSLPPRALAELNTPGDERGPWLSPDGLTIYWWVRPADRSESQIWTASRPAFHKPFGLKRKLASGESPTFSSDGLEMIYRPIGDLKLQVARRRSVDDPFGPPRTIDELADHLVDSPALSADGLSLFIELRSGSSTGYYVSNRLGIGTRWTVPKPLTLPNSPYQNVRLRTPFLQRDGLTLWGAIIVDRMTGEGGRILNWKRRSAEEDFGSPVLMANTPVVDVTSPRACELSRELFFVKFPKPGDLYVMPLP